MRTENRLWITVCYMDTITLALNQMGVNICNFVIRDYHNENALKSKVKITIVNHNTYSSNPEHTSWRQGHHLLHQVHQALPVAPDLHAICTSVLSVKASAVSLICPVDARDCCALWHIPRFAEWTHAVLSIPSMHTSAQTTPSISYCLLPYRCDSDTDHLLALAQWVCASPSTGFSSRQKV